MTKRSKRCIDDLLAISRMLTRRALVAALEIAGKASHQLLRICTLGAWGFCQKLLSVAAAERCCDSTMVQDFHGATFSMPVAKPETGESCWRFGSHGLAGAC